MTDSNNFEFWTDERSKRRGQIYLHYALQEGGKDRAAGLKSKDKEFRESKKDFVIPQLLHDEWVQVRNSNPAVIDWNLPLGITTSQVRTWQQGK